MVRWPPPARQMADKLLDRKVGAANSVMKTTMEDAWCSRRTGLRNDLCRPLTAPKEKKHVCFTAGRQVCNTVEGRNLIRLVEGLSIILTHTREGWLKKNSLGRKLYDTARLSLRVFKNISRFAPTILGCMRGMVISTIVCSHA